MADQSPELLNKTPESVVTSQAPREPLSAGQIEQPFQDVSALLGKFGEATGDLAVPLAQRQAATDLANQKVIRKPDGTVGVLNPASAMILGDAGRTYARAVQEGTSDQILASVRPDLAAIHAEHPLDGDALAKANQAYLQKLAGSPAIANSGVIGEAVLRSARDMVAQHQDAAMMAGAANQVENTKKAILATVEDKKNALFALANTPGGPDKPEWASAKADYDAALGKLGSNDLFKMPAEYLATQRKEFMGELQATQAGAQIDQLFDRKGKAYAQQEALKILQNPDIPPEKANLIYRQTMSRLEFRTQDQIAAQEASKTEIIALREALAKNQISPSDPLIAATRANALKAGGPELAAQIDGLISGRQAFNAAHGLPLANVPAALGVPSGPEAAVDASGPRSRVGGTTSTQYLSALAGGDVQGALRASEGLRTSPYWDVNHLRTGYGSDTVTLADGTVKAVDANTKITPADAERDLARRTADYATQARGAIGPNWDSFSKPAQAALTSMAYNYGHVPDDVVRAAKTGNPQAIADAISAHANDNNGANYARRMAEASAVMGKGAPAISINGNPFTGDLATNTWARVEYFRLLAGSAPERGKYFETAYQGSTNALKAGIMPAQDALTTLIQTTEGNPEKEAKVTEILGMVSALKASQSGGGGAVAEPQRSQGGGAAPMTSAQIAQSAEDMRAIAAKSPDMVHQNLALSASKQFDEISKHAAEHPMTWGAQQFDLGEVPKIDLSQPQTIAQSLLQRDMIAQQIGVHNRTAPPPTLEKGDGAALQGAMQGPAGAQIAGAISQTMPPAALMRLADQPEFRDAVTGMSRSGDPAKMNAAYSLMDKLQQQNPLEFDAKFKDGLKDLRSWQSNLAFYPPDVAAKRLMTQYDPSQSQAIEQAKKVADEALKSISPAAVVSKFNGWITKAQTPASAMQGVAAQALKDDYAENYRDGFAATGDASMADKFAMEKLNNKYAVSAVNGNRVTAYAPEKYYPEVGGSQAWMQDQLNSAIADHLGVKLSPEPLGPAERSGPDEAVRRYDAPRALVPDQTTQADIAAGRPPSYQVIVQDKDGRFQALTDPNGAASRFRFDPAPYQKPIHDAQDQVMAQQQEASRIAQDLYAQKVRHGIIAPGGFSQTQSRF